ncbi:unnamed protein product [Heligmosomoides polygyrus]|uniref:Neur_chan_LBD domain-containing protein n=1 Tax=Heligmosomoides polygyrus TaxID=6339 RepID=A0A183FJS4_HELPZ|nr:unnamed protein product [Heligmosomoides polygyrus]
MLVDFDRVCGNIELIGLMHDQDFTFDNDVVINVKRGVRQWDTTSHKLFSAALEYVMHELKWEDMGVTAGNCTIFVSLMTSCS